MIQIPDRGNADIAQNASQARHPSLWRGLDTLYVPHLDGTALHNRAMGKRKPATIVSGGSWAGTRAGLMWEADGSADYVNTNNANFFGQIGGNVSASMWFEIVGTPGVNNTFFGAADSGKSYWIHISARSGTVITLRIEVVSDSKTWRWEYASWEVGDGPHNFTFSVDASDTANFALYIDGKKVTHSLTINQAVSDFTGHTSPMYLLALNQDPSPGGQMAARIGTFATWGRIITTSEANLIGTDPFAPLLPADTPNVIFLAKEANHRRLMGVGS